MKSKFVFNSINSNRQDLDINLPLILGSGLVISSVIYILLLPFRQTFLGILLYERGFTQILVISLAAMVATISFLKFLKIKSQYRVFKLELIPRNIDLEDPNSNQIINLQQNLVKQKNLLAQRCSRVLAAYIHSSSRQTAFEFAMEDSAFYQSISESSYLVPRILVWAIPLLGFIGTVLGISQAVNGFSGFLEQAGDLEQIKEGIGSVTGGLAVAFDTTLLALFLSVLVMIPLVFVERLEFKLLLAIDIYINDKLLPQFKHSEEDFNQEKFKEAIADTIQNNLPSTELLIEPAKQYAEAAAKILAESFIKEVSVIEPIFLGILQQLNTFNEQNLQERQSFLNLLNIQMETNKNLLDQQVEYILNLLEESRSIIKAIEANNTTVGVNFKEQSEMMKNQLERAANSLTEKITSLEKYANQINEIQVLQMSLNENLKSLKEKETLEVVLAKTQISLAELQVVMQKLSQPRQILLIEQQTPEES